MRSKKQESNSKKDAHTTTAFRNTSNDEQQPPKGYTKAQTERAYQLDLQQRAMEREIRRVKERAHLLKGVEDVEKGATAEMFAQARKMTEAYRKFCRDNNRVAMIYRTQVTVEEQAYNQRRQRTVYNDVVDKSTGEIITPAGTQFDKGRLIYGDGAKTEIKKRQYYEPQLGGDPLHYRKMSGIIKQNNKNVDAVHWVQNAVVDKTDEKDVTDRLNKK